MGCDIHEFFEIQQADGTWAPLFPRVPDNYWWEYILDDMVDNGAGAVLTFSSDNEVGRAEVKKLLTAMTAEEAVEKYGHRPDFSWHWDLPILAAPEASWRSPETGNRDYAWFGFIAGVRHDSNLIPEFEPRGFPADACEAIAVEYQRWQGDAHTPSWLMVQEIIDRPELKDKLQVKWLKTFIAEPKRSRMVFYFDN